MEIIQKDLQVSGGVWTREEAALLLACICNYLEKAGFSSFALSSARQSKDDDTPPPRLQSLRMSLASVEPFIGDVYQCISLSVSQLLPARVLVEPNRRAPSLPPPMRGSGFGLQQFEEQFVHGHPSVLFDAAEVLDGPRRRLTEKREGHDQLAGPPGVLGVAGGFVVLQGPVKNILESLDSLGILNLHGICTEG